MPLLCKIFGHQTLKTRVVRCGEGDIAFLGAYGPGCVKFTILDKVECLRCGATKGRQEFYHEIRDAHNNPMTPNPDFMARWED